MEDCKSSKSVAWFKGLEIAILVIMAIAASGLPAAAQIPRVELSGGYQYTHVPDLNFGLGWAGDITANLGDLFGVVGEISGAHSTMTEFVGRQSIHVDLTLLTYLAGLRVASHINPRVVPFVQVLGGVARASGSTNVPTIGFDVGVSDTRPAMQWGGGVLLMMSRSVGIRLSADYRAVFIDEGRENEFRFGTGIVAALGR